MNQPHPNGKSTTMLVISILGAVASISAPLIVMYSKLNALEVSTSERLREIETQFRASDQVRNTNYAFQQRLNGLLWEKVYGQPLPPMTYFPTIAN